MEIMDNAEIAGRLETIERKLDTILRHLGLPSGETDPHRIPEVMELVQAGKKIQAIKVYRQTTGAGLRAAKEAVDAASAGC